jgi:preprotein translocase subunit SecG
MELFLIAQMVISGALVAAILLQARGAGLSATFGGESTAYRSRRGLERTLFRLTIGLAAVFVLISLISVIQRPG